MSEMALIEPRCGDAVQHGSVFQDRQIELPPIESHETRFLLLHILVVADTVISKDVA